MKVAFLQAAVYVVSVTIILVIERRKRKNIIEAATEAMEEHRKVIGKHGERCLRAGIDLGVEITLSSLKTAGLVSEELQVEIRDAVKEATKESTATEPKIDDATFLKQMGIKSE